MSTTTATEATALMSDGWRRKGLADLASGLFVYADYKAGRAVTVFPHGVKGKGATWVTLVDTATDEVLLRCWERSS